MKKAILKNKTHLNCKALYINPKNIKFFAEHILKENLTVIPQFHSHLEPMRNIGDIDRQITLSFSEANTISLDGPFSKQVDPTRYFFPIFLLWMN